jgi:hypothetical protein
MIRQRKIGFQGRKMWEGIYIGETNRVRFVCRFLCVLSGWIRSLELSSVKILIPAFRQKRSWIKTSQK